MKHLNFILLLALMALGHAAWSQTQPETVYILDNTSDDLFREYLESNKPYYIQIMTTIALSYGDIEVRSNKTIDLYGNSINCGYACFDIQHDSQLTIKNTGYEGVMLGSPGNNYTFKVEPNAKLIIQSGSIKGRGSEYCSEKGGLIYNKGTLEITGGTISKGNANRGGAIFNDGGTVTISPNDVLNPIRIINNTATHGGAIYNNGGTVTISQNETYYEITIDTNTVTGYGGAIYNTDINSHDAVLNVTAGSISNNSAASGGGIYCNSGTLNMSGNPVVANNTGGNVYLNSDQLINVNAAFTSGANIGVTRADGLVNGYGDFTSGYATYNPSTNPATVFHSDYIGNEVTLHNDEASLTEIFASYIDENGVEQTHAVIPLTGSETSLGPGWYFVNSDLSYTSSLSFSNNSYLILADGVTLSALSISGSSCNLTIYGQSQSTGAIVLTSSCTLGSLTMNGGNLSITSSSGYAFRVEDGNLTINRGTVEVTAGGFGINLSNNCNYVQNGGTVTVNSLYGCIYADDFTLNNGTLNVTSTEAHALQLFGNVNILGGQLTATSNATSYYGLNAESGNVTLDWTNPDDFITVSSYHLGYGTLAVANGKYFQYQAGGGIHTISGTITDPGIIAGKTLTPSNPVAYVDGNGTEHMCNNYTVLTGGGATTLTEGWYVVDDNITYNGTLTLAGNVTLILCNGKTMTVTSDNGNSIHGINNPSDGFALTVYGQTLDSNTAGTLYVTNDVENKNAIELITYTQHSGKVVVSDLSDKAIHAYGDFTLNGGTVDATGTALFGIHSGSVTINGGIVNASGNTGIYCNNLNFNGGTVNATSNGCGIFAEDNIIFSWTNTSDCIFVSSYVASGTVSVKGGQAFYYEDGETVIVSGTLNEAQIAAIGGKTLSPYHSLDPVAYIDENGVMQQCTFYTVVTDNLNFNNLPAGWYVVNDNIILNGQVHFSSDAHLILCDGKTMTVTSESGSSIYGGNLLTIYGQTLDSNAGTLNANATNSEGSAGIEANDVTINGGTVNANGYYIGIDSYNAITINGGTVNATGAQLYDIQVQSGITINGGIVNATGGFGGICANGGDIILGWTNTDDYILVSNYYTVAGSPVSVKSGQAFYYQNGNETVVVSGTLNNDQIEAIGGKTLRPYFVSRTVAGYGQSNDGWVLIASPLASDVNPEDVNGLCTNAFDLYRFNQGAELEWENWKSHANNDNHYHFDLENGRGYLYATQANTILRFSGILYEGEGEVTLTKTDNASLGAWNLIGNPFVTAATLGSKPFYRMNDYGTEIIAAETSTVAAMEGVFVEANTDGETVTFAPLRSPLERGRQGGQGESEESIIINLCNNAGNVIDRAIVRFGEGKTLLKFQIRDNSTKVCIPLNGKEYAIANAETTGEMPLNFKAKENGTYTITVNPEGVEMGYLHLIDNLTGADVDLLPTQNLIAGEDPQSLVPSYTFQAKTTDYASRFRLVFAPVCEDADDDNETFAFISNGNIIVNGTGTLQVFDALGRQVLTRELSTVNSQLSTVNFPAGVYVLRLIDGDDVKTQKIVMK